MTKFNLDDTVFVALAPRGTPLDRRLSLLGEQLSGLQGRVIAIDEKTTPPTYRVAFEFSFRENELMSGQEYAAHRYFQERLETALSGAPRLRFKDALTVIRS